MDKLNDKLQEICEVMKASYFAIKDEKKKEKCFNDIFAKKVYPVIPRRNG